MTTKPAPKPTELSTAKLRWTCELSRIPFETTAQAELREGFVGQERALRALKMGVELSAPGYNVFVCGLAGTSRGGTIARMIQELHPPTKESLDRCYVNNFKLPDRPRLLAVTILTSMDQKTMKEVGVGGTPKSRVVKLAQLAKESGVDGVVASVQETKAIRKGCGADFLIVTPGVRPKDSAVESTADDQSRKATPKEAIRAGADFLVVGRPILAAADPRAAAQSIVDEIAAAK